MMCFLYYFLMVYGTDKKIFKSQIIHSVVFKIFAPISTRIYSVTVIVFSVCFLFTFFVAFLLHIIGLSYNNTALYYFLFNDFLLTSFFIESTYVLSSIHTTYACVVQEFTKFLFSKSLRVPKTTPFCQYLFVGSISHTYSIFLIFLTCSAFIFNGYDVVIS